MLVVSNKGLLIVTYCTVHVLAYAWVRFWFHGWPVISKVDPSRGVSLCV